MKLKTGVVAESVSARKKNILQFTMFIFFAAIFEVEKKSSSLNLSERGPGGHFIAIKSS